MTSYDPVPESHGVIPTLERGHGSHLRVLFKQHICGCHLSLSLRAVRLGF